MRIRIEAAWGGTSREPVYVVYEDGRRVASFDDDAEAVQWAKDEYGVEEEEIESA